MRPKFSVWVRKGGALGSLASVGEGHLSPAELTASGENEVFKVLVLGSFLDTLFLQRIHKLVPLLDHLNHLLEYFLLLLLIILIFLAL